MLNFQNVAAEIIPYHEVHSAVSLDDDSTSSSSSTSDSSSSSSDSNTKFSDLNPTLQGIVFRILMSVAMIFVVLLLIVLFIRSKSERFLLNSSEELMMIQIIVILLKVMGLRKNLPILRTILQKSQELSCSGQFELVSFLILKDQKNWIVGGQI